jgi:molybdopterin-guanine dinucleotide biosynthesis protein A
MGVLLAGGYGTRFGDGEKALADLDGSPLLGHVLDGLEPAVDGIVINCRADQRAAFQSVLGGHGGDIVFVCDPTPDRGPAAGLATALKTVAAPAVALVGCDMPYVDPSFLTWLFEQLGEDTGGVVPMVDGHPQPLHAVYRTASTRQAAREAVATGSGSLREVLDILEPRRLPETEVLERTSHRTFRDINTQADLAAAQGEE